MMELEMADGVWLFAMSTIKECNEKRLQPHSSIRDQGIQRETVEALTGNNWGRLVPCVQPAAFRALVNRTELNS